MNNAMQLKAAINKMAKEKHIPAQLVMQNYMLERLLERIAHSRYQGNFILKGGLLIASMVGLHSRATMDLDATIRNYPVNENSIKKMFPKLQYQIGQSSITESKFMDEDFLVQHRSALVAFHNLEFCVAAY